MSAAVISRYAKAKENLKDRITYHTGVLIEWQSSSGRRYCSVVELAWLNGLGGYRGKSNFVPDRDEPRTALYSAMPDCMKAPWFTRYLCPLSRINSSCNPHFLSPPINSSY